MRGVAVPLLEEQSLWIPSARWASRENMGAGGHGCHIGDQRPGRQLAKMRESRERRMGRRRPGAAIGGERANLVALFSLWERQVSSIQPSRFHHLEGECLNLRLCVVSDRGLDCPPI